MLYIVATPIGNLDDISNRALQILNQADFILSENPTTTKKLLSHFEIKKQIIKYHQHSKSKKISHVLSLLKQSKDLALVSEAGTPAISDPGAKLIDKAYKAGFKVIPIPGPSALISAASISGFPMDNFLFLGFPPKKRKRDLFFKKVANSKCPVIFYESPHRILKTLEELNKALKESKKQETQIFVARELTKKYESTYRGQIEDVINKIKQDPVKGEFVVVIEP